MTLSDTRGAEIASPWVHLQAFKLLIGRGCASHDKEPRKSCKYEQTLILPDDVDKERIGAKVADGILTVDLPKIEETKVKVARSIEIS